MASLVTFDTFEDRLYQSITDLPDVQIGKSEYMTLLKMTLSLSHAC
jgi:hypothetical protein